MTDIIGAPSFLGIKLIDVAIVVLVLIIIGSLVRNFYRAIKKRKSGDRRHEKSKELSKKESL